MNAMNAQYRNEMEKRFAERSTGTSATRDEYETLEREAHAHAHAHARGTMHGIYVADGNATLTPERAVASALESNPEVYAAYRDKHNAGAILNTLARAGVRLPGA